MDISRIRKKLKETEAEEEQKKEDLTEEKSEADNVSVEKDINESSSEKSAEKTEIDKADTITDETENDLSASPANEIELLSFNVGNEEYAVKLADLQEIIRDQTVTPVPRSPAYLKGVTFLRGKILPIIDLAKRLGLKEDGGLLQKIIVLAVSRSPLGVLIGSGVDILRFREDEVLPPPSTLDENEIGLIEGVVSINNRFISLLNVNNILKADI